MNKKLIVALDFSDKCSALNLLSKIDSNLCAIKIGLELFMSTGREFVSELAHQGYTIFLDLKFHDIPNTVAKACAAAADLGVWMLTLHAAGGLAMLKAAKEAVESYGEKRPKMIAVTALTSLIQADLPSMGVSLSSLDAYVEKLAKLAEAAFLDGIVCSAEELKRVKAIFGAEFLTVVPGIRLQNDKIGDQKRIATPKEAIQLGADFLVVGRPISQAQDPTLVINTILKNIRF